MTSITIIGTGNMGQAIAGLASAGGHKAELIGHSDTGKTAAGDIVVLAVPYPAVPDVIARHGYRAPARSSSTSPTRWTPRPSIRRRGRQLGHREIAAALPQSRVVKAFNTNFAHTLAGTNGPVPTTVLIAGDDADAKAALSEVVTSAGLRAVDAGLPAPGPRAGGLRLPADDPGCGPEGRRFAPFSDPQALSLPGAAPPASAGPPEPGHGAALPGPVPRPLPERVTLMQVPIYDIEPAAHGVLHRGQGPQPPAPPVAAQRRRTAALYLGHGAPPLIDDPLWSAQLLDWSLSLPKPKAILIVSAHWEDAPLSISAKREHAPGTISGASRSATTRSPTPPRMPANYTAASSPRCLTVFTCISTRPGALITGPTCRCRSCTRWLTSR